MRRFIIILAVLSTSLVAAQPNGPQEGHPGNHDKPLHDFTPEQIADLQTKQLTLALDLTPAQQASVKALNLDIAKNRKDNAPKKEDRPTQDERYSKMASHLDQQIAIKKSFKSILSPEQYSRWEKMSHRKGTKKRQARREGKQGGKRNKRH